MAEELKMKPQQARSDVNPENAMTSAIGNMASWFLKDNKEKGRPLKIPSLGISVHSDGTVEKLPQNK
jgi:hypothetical protein